MFLKQKYLLDTITPLPSSMAWLLQRRAQALAQFKGYPTRAVEGWKYSNAKALLEQNNSARTHQGDIAALVKKLDALPEACRIVCVNGVFNTGLSHLPNQAGVMIAPLAKILQESPHLLENSLGKLANRNFAAASLAETEEGAFVQLETGVNLELPLTIVHIHTSGKSQARNIILLGALTQAEITEYHLGVQTYAYSANHTTEIFLGSAANLIHTTLAEHSASGASLVQRHIQQEKQSRYSSVLFTTGAKMNRTETHIAIKGEKAHASQHTIQLLSGDSHSDSTTQITHDALHSTSNQHCRMILDDTAKGSFQGKTLVARNAQKTAATQLCKNLLLSRNAEVNAKPELEIYADDVTCSHGVTTGELDEMALFYLQSRGLDENTAKRLLVEAFADTVIEETMLSEAMKTYLREKVAEWMGEK